MRLSFIFKTYLVQEDKSDRNFIYKLFTITQPMESLFTLITLHKYMWGKVTISRLEVFNLNIS